jgi:hypothetical protein
MVYLVVTYTLNHGAEMIGREGTFGSAANKSIQLNRRRERLGVLIYRHQEEK